MATAPTLPVGLLTDANALTVYRTMSSVPLFYPPWKMPPGHPLHVALKKQQKLQPRKRKDIFLFRTSTLTSAASSDGAMMGMEGQLRTPFPNLAVLDSEDTLLESALAASGQEVAAKNPFKRHFIEGQLFDLQDQLEQYQQIAEAYTEWAALYGKKNQKSSSLSSKASDKSGEAPKRKATNKRKNAQQC